MDSVGVGLGLSLGGGGLMIGALLSSLGMMISSWEDSDRVKDSYLDKNRRELHGDGFDFIVVGSGTSGSLLASRLASKEYKVLLLEAGGEPHPFHGIPMVSNFMTGYPQTDWMHETTSQQNALFGLIENKGLISGGKGLGGSSNLDHSNFLRGHPKDYESWTNASGGDTSWSYDKLLPYFKRHENYQGSWKDEKIGKLMHGFNGEIRLGQNLPEDSELGKRFIIAGNEMGIPHVDLNGIYDQGFDMVTSPSFRGRRQSSYDAFIRRDQRKWNLETRKYSTVRKVLIRGESNEAFGVEYERHGSIRISYARKEVILCAGGINSAVILLHSGIGDWNELQKVGIAPKVHLPHVGKNLQDHLGVELGPFFITKGKPGKSILLERDIGPTSWLALNQGDGGSGPLARNGLEATALLTTDRAKIQNSDWPDVQLTINSMAIQSSTFEHMVHSHRLRRDLLENYYQGSQGRDSFSIIVTGNRPKSRGHVRLVDKGPHTRPLIDPGYLNELDDVGVLVDGIKKSMRLVEGSVQFQEIGATFTNRSLPGCEQYRTGSEEYWACFVRVMALPMGHIVGTVRLGSVVDSQLRVRGTTRLRVIDASIIPSLVSGGTCAATLAIGEKGADMILRYWGTPDKKAVLQNESKQVQTVLKNNAKKLRAMEGVSGSLFMRYMRGMPSYREMVDNFKTHPGTLRNPFTIIRPLLQATLTGPYATEETTNDKVRNEINQDRSTTLETTTTVKTTTTTSSNVKPSPRPPISSLFFTGQPKPVTLSKVVLPYLLLPSTTPYPFPHSLASAVDSYLYAHNPMPVAVLPSSRNRFSKTLPILGFSNVIKEQTLSEVQDPGTNSSNFLFSMAGSIPESSVWTVTTTTMMPIDPDVQPWLPQSVEDAKSRIINALELAALVKSKQSSQPQFEKEVPTEVAGFLSQTKDLSNNVQKYLEQKTRKQRQEMKDEPMESKILAQQSSQFSQVLTKMVEEHVLNDSRDKKESTHVHNRTSGNENDGNDNQIPKTSTEDDTASGTSFRMKILDNKNLIMT